MVFELELYLTRGDLRSYNLRSSSSLEVWSSSCHLICIYEFIYIAFISFFCSYLIKSFCKSDLHETQDRDEQLQSRDCNVTKTIVFAGEHEHKLREKINLHFAEYICSLPNGGSLARRQTTRCLSLFFLPFCSSVAFFLRFGVECFIS